MASKKSEKEEEKEGPCFNCNKPCGDDQFCHGCKHHICEDCDINPQWGPHEPEDHLEEDGL